MLNFMNNNNLSLLDPNLLTLGLVIGGVSVLGFSAYYFKDYLYDCLFKTTYDCGTQTEINNVDKGINTEGTELTEAAVETDIDMLYDHMRELLYNNATPTTSLGEISPTDFIREYRNNPEFANYFDKTAKWAEYIGDPRLMQSNSSEYRFLLKMKEALGSNSSSSSNLNHSVPQIREPIVPQGEIEGLRLAKFDELINKGDFIRNDNTEELLRTIINSHDYFYLILPSNNSEIIASVLMLIS
jgi:hypothetical protein